MKKLKPASRILVAVSALLMSTACFVPLWQILMWAPQYPEGLEMKIWINNITGDVKIISALNHYIGMKHIEVSMFPEFFYMIYLVGGLILVGLLAAILNKRIGLVIYVSLIIAAGVAALVDFYIWGYEYGHNLDPTAPIVVPGMSYQPPLIGTKQLLNFTAYSGPAVGGWFFVVAGLLAISTLAFEIYRSRKTSAKINRSLVFAPMFIFYLTSCSVEPEPLKFGSDQCHSCKMTLVDKKFGAEIVTNKGKIYKFDDVNCMINFFNQWNVAEQEMQHLLVVDFSQSEKLMDARNALYIKSEMVKSPMAANVAAFEKKESLDQFNKDWKGILLSWGELRTQFK
jgi:copper chaperone NosL